MGPVSIDPGVLTARLQLERRVEMPDGQGGATVSFASVASLWCRIEPLSATVEEEAGAETVTVTHRIWLRFRHDIESGMRFRKGLRLFEVRSLRDPDETGCYLVASVEEVGR